MISILLYSYHYYISLPLYLLWLYSQQKNKKCQKFVYKDKYRCIECGGAGICVHNKDKYRCIECGGAGICVHKKRKLRCYECGGSQICEHKKIETNMS